MKKHLSLFFCLLFSYSFVFSQSYYWYNKAKVPITPDPSAFFLKLGNIGGKPGFQKNDIASFLGISDSSLYAVSDNEFISISPSTLDSKLLQSKNIDLVYKGALYKNASGGTMLILPVITVEFNEGFSLKEFLGEYENILSLREDRGFNTYLFDCKLKNSEDVLKLSNSLNEKNTAIKWSEPDFYTNGKVNVDPLFPDQYYLKNTGQNGGTAGIDINIEPVWTFSTGLSTLRVAVVDQGVENHEDLNGRVINGYTAGSTTGTGVPQNGVKGHGQACAGIIAATHNNLGISGIAPNVLILPINICPNAEVPGVNPDGFATNAQIAASLDWAWNQGAADVLSCSWSLGTQSNDVDAAINRARTQGRLRGTSRMGCPVIFASGNNSGSVTYPANLAGVITVGAIHNDGTIWNYSATGASLEIVAPSGATDLAGDVRTLDRMGANGYNVGNYMNNFGGTSAAAPQAAGVAALILSENINLTETQVRIQLQGTATDMGAAGFDNTFGYGRINACEAVRGALTGALKINGDEVICSGTKQYTLRWGNGLPNSTGAVFGGALTWASSNSSVLTVSSTGNPVTVTKVGNGQATITATFATGCGNIQRSMNIAAGPPPAPTITYTYQGSNIYIFTASFTGVGLGFNWWVNGVQKRWNSDNITYWEIPCGQTATLKCNQMNSCGTSAFSSDVTVTNFGCLGLRAFTMSPNPSTGTVNIELQNLAQEKQAKPGQLKQPVIKEVFLYDQSGNLRKKWKVTNNTSTYQINVSGFASGVYFLEVSDGTLKQRQQLLIQK